MVSLYVDDTLIGAASCGDNFMNSAALIFGCADTACAEPFQGLIDDVSVRDKSSDANLLINDYCADQALINPNGTASASCQ
jgi:hypothetical protein